MPNRPARRGSPTLRSSAAFVALGLLSAACAPTEAPLAPVLRAGDAPSRLAAPLPSVRIAEIHYDNASTDVNERIEVSGPAGTSLAGWRLVLYNGNPTQRSAYATLNLTGTIANSCDGRGVLVFNGPAGGIQNGGAGATGEPDGIALVDATNTVVEFLSYEGSFTAVTPASATTNPAGGITSTNIGVFQNGSEDASLSLQRTGAGLNTWSAPATNTFGACNDNAAGQPPATIASIGVTPASASIVVGGSQLYTAAALDAQGNPVAGASITWSIADASPVATVGTTGLVTGAQAGTATVVATSGGVTGRATVTVTAAPPVAGNVLISEIHYDDNSTDAGEAIEVEGDAGTVLDGWRLVLYNGNGGLSYATLNLSGTLASTCDGRGVAFVPGPATGIQNGDPDGVALVAPDGQVVQFLSYEGTFTATDGPANGRTSVAIAGVREAGTEPDGLSLQRARDGVWFGPATHTFGACNAATAPPPPEPEPTTGIAVEGYSFRGSAPLPVGFQELYRVKDVATNAFVRTGIVWTSSNDAVASVDPLGNVTARSVGTVRITATETATGRTDDIGVTTTLLTYSDLSVYADELQFGTPTDATPADDYVVNRATFASSWSAALGQPTWVAYNLEATHRDPVADRCDCFVHDPELPASFPVITSADYDGSSYSRGHMTMSADRTRGGLDNATTFYFSNIIPQTSQNNGGPWLALEQDLGALARNQNKEIFIFAGGAAYSGTLNNAGRVAIPTRTWKLAVILDRNEGIADVASAGDVEIIAVDMPNTTSALSGDWNAYRVSVDHIEALTGYDFLSALPDGIEQIVEARRAGVRQVFMDLQPAQLSVSGTTLVHVTLFSEATFDAAAVSAADVRLVVNGGTAVAPSMRGGVVSSYVRDMNGDGRPDRVVSFTMSALRDAGFSPSGRQLVLRPVGPSPAWEAFDGTPPNVVP